MGYFETQNYQEAAKAFIDLVEDSLNAEQAVIYRYLPLCQAHLQQKNDVSASLAQAEKLKDAGFIKPEDWQKLKAKAEALLEAN